MITSALCPGSGFAGFCPTLATTNCLATSVRGLSCWSTTPYRSLSHPLRSSGHCCGTELRAVFGPCSLAPRLGSLNPQTRFAAGTAKGRLRESPGRHTARLQASTVSCLAPPVSPTSDLPVNSDLRELIGAMPSGSTHLCMAGQMCMDRSAPPAPLGGAVVLVRPRRYAMHVRTKHAAWQVV